MEGETDVIRSIFDDLHSWYIQADQMEGESKVLLEVKSMNIILWISNEIKWKVKVVLLEVSLINFILRISNEIQWKVKVVLLEVSLMHFIDGISNEIKCKVKVV